MSNTAKLTTQHEMLALLAGAWRGTTKIFFEEGVVASESPVEATMKPILGGRFVLHEYEFVTNDTRIQGVALYGYHVDKQQFECAWADGFHMGTGMMFSKGNGNMKDFLVQGSYGFKDEKGDEQMWGWETSIEMPNSNTVHITMANISPEGKKAGGVETSYTRKQ